LFHQFDKKAAGYFSLAAAGAVPVDIFIAASLSCIDNLVPSASALFDLIGRRPMMML